MVRVGVVVPLVGRTGMTPVAEVVVVRLVDGEVEDAEEEDGAHELKAQTRSVGQQPPPKLAGQAWTLRGQAVDDVDVTVLKDVLVRVTEEAVTVNVRVMTVVTTAGGSMAQPPSTQLNPGIQHPPPSIEGQGVFGASHWVTAPTHCAPDGQHPITPNPVSGILKHVSSVAQQLVGDMSIEQSFVPVGQVKSLAFRAAKTPATSRLLNTCLAFNSSAPAIFSVCSTNDGLKFTTALSFPFDRSSSSDCEKSFLLLTAALSLGESNTLLCPSNSNSPSNCQYSI